MLGSPHEQPESVDFELLYLHETNRLCNCQHKKLELQFLDNLYNVVLFFSSTFFSRNFIYIAKELAEKLVLSTSFHNRRNHTNDQFVNAKNYLNELPQIKFKNVYFLTIA